MAAITPENIEKPEAKPVLKELPRKLRDELPALPCKKGGTCTKEQAERWFDAITDEELKRRVTIYVYRLHPKIVSDTSPLYIQKYSSLSDWSENQFIADHGGGIYKFSVNVIGEEHSVLHYKYEVDMTLYTPVFDLKILDLANRDNKSWIEAQKNKGKIKQTTKGLVWTDQEELKPMSRSNEESPSELISTITGVFKEFAQMNQKPSSDPALTAILTELTKPKPSALKELEPLIAVFAPMLQEMLKPKPQDDTLIKLLMQQAEQAKNAEIAAREATNKMMEKFLDQKPTDPFAIIMKAKEIEQMFSKEAPEPEKKDKFDKFMEMFGSLAPVLLGGMMNRNAVLPSQNPNQVVPQYPGVAVARQPLPSQVNPQDLLNQFNDPSFSTILADKINEETPGWAFAYMVEDMMGKESYNRVVAFDKSVILQCLTSSSVKAKLKPEINLGKLDEFVSDFIEYEKFDPETGLKRMVQ